MLETVFQEIIGELPWVDHTRLIVGPLASRESVKDALLEKTSVIPSWAVGTLYEFAAQIAKPKDKPLSLASQCDALERIAREPFLRDAVPELCAHLKSRQVCIKIARFLTHLDKFFAHGDDLEAVVEYYLTKDESLGAFLKVVSQLWEAGELSPWGEGAALRAAVAALDEAQTLPKKIYLWGFAEFTPLEEVFLEKLTSCGVEVALAVPAKLLESFEPRCQSLKIIPVALPDTNAGLEIWEPHSAWDELEFLRERLRELRESGVAWRDIAVFVPGDDLYKRLARDKLTEWNVPLHDPTLSGGWKDQPRFIWWRDLLRTVSSGLKIDDVRAWLGPGKERQKFFEAAYTRGIHGNAGAWSRLLEQFDLPELRLLVEGVAVFGRSMKCQDFLKACKKFVPRAEELLGNEIESGLLLEFARHLCEEREYLDGFRSRLPKYVSLFEEFLDAKARKLSKRSQEGLHFVGHGVWLPRAVTQAFVLGSNALVRGGRSSDAWDWEGVEVRRAWEKLHFGMRWEDRVLRDETFLLHGLQDAEHVVFSSSEYSLSGKPQARSAIFQRVKGESAAARSGGHLAVGWSLTGATPASAIRAIARSDFAPDGSVRISAFEDYLKCPFLYYARHVLRLDKENELGLDPDGRARGNILHKVLERYVREEIDGAPSKSVDAAKKRIAALVDEEVSAQKLTGMFRHQPLVEKARAMIRSYAEAWIEWEFENRKKHPELKPFAVEKSIELEFGGLKMRGKIDRVDSDGKHAVVIDYKTGTPPFIGRELREGVGAQLLMYARGVELCDGLEPGAVFYLGLGRKIDGSKGVFLKKHQKTLHTTNARNSGLVDGEFSTLFDQVNERWTRAAENLMKGQFSAAPARGEKECNACSFKNICGYTFEVPGAEGEQ